MITAALLALRIAAASALFGQPREETHNLPGWKGEEISVSGDAVVYGQEDWRGEIVQLSWEPRAYLLKGFLSDEECDHMIDLAKPSMRKSSVADSTTGKSVASEVRTSTGTFLAKQQDEVVKRIEKRVAQVTMIPLENQEGMQILHYVDGQQYKPHHDYFHDKLNQSVEKGGQRLATVLMYLTTVEEGGETIFPEADRKSTGPEWSECAKEGMAVKTVKGNAVMFFSLHPDGTEDPSSLHGSCPTIKGEKWSATKWIHVTGNGTTKKQQMAGWAGKKGECKDEDDDCAGWAEAGECEKNPEFMKRKCRKSCKHC